MNHPPGISKIWLQVREESMKKFKNPTIFWQSAGTYYLNMVTSEKKFLNIWQDWSNSFHKKSFV
jgi:hypothetical protein